MKIQAAWAQLADHHPGLRSDATCIPLLYAGGQLKSRYEAVKALRASMRKAKGIDIHTANKEVTTQIW